MSSLTVLPGAIAQLFSSSPPSLIPPDTTIPYRPPQWSSKPQQYSLSVTQQVQLPATRVQSRISTGQIIPPTTTPATTSAVTTIYYFDAVVSADHRTSLEITRHPVQSGNSIVDHAYSVPARVVLEIAMSDAIDSFVHGQYATNQSKSISAYQTFEALRKSRLPMTLSTRLQQYSNMLIKEIHAPDTNATVAGLKVTIVFEQITLALVSTQTISVRPDQSQSTNSGNIQPTTVDAAVQAQHVQTQFSQSNVQTAAKQANSAYAEFPNPRWCSNSGNGGLPFGRK